MEFFLPMIPPTVTQQEHKVAVIKGKPIFYDPPELAAAKNKLSGHLAPHRPKAPMNGAIRLTVKWLFPRGDHEDGEYRVTKPDTDNLQKMLKDVMTLCHYWNDDAQVASEIVEKFWAETSGIYIKVESL